VKGESNSRCAGMHAVKECQTATDRGLGQWALRKDSAAAGVIRVRDLMPPADQPRRGSFSIESARGTRKQRRSVRLKPVRQRRVPRTAAAQSRTATATPLGSSGASKIATSECATPKCANPSALRPSAPRPSAPTSSVPNRSAVTARRPGKNIDPRTPSSGCRLPVCHDPVCHLSVRQAPDRHVEGCQTKAAKPRLPNQGCQTKVAKPRLPNQGCQTKCAKPSAPNASAPVRGLPTAMSMGSPPGCRSKSLAEGARGC
jgi:hypothetical protein